MSRSGKSTLVKRTVIPSHRRLGRWVGVLDPVLSQVVGAAQAARLWGANWVTADPHAFIYAMKNSMGCVWIIDEFRVFATDYKALKALEWGFFAAGNWGHLCYAMAQRLMMIPPNVREQCSNAIVFAQTRDGLEVLARQYNQPAILACESFPRFQAMVVTPFKTPLIIKGPAP